MVRAGGRPRGPEKKELTITLPVPVWEWLDSMLAERRIANKSFFIEQLLRAAMEEEEHDRNILAQLSPEDRKRLLEIWDKEKQRPKRGD